MTASNTTVGTQNSFVSANSTRKENTTVARQGTGKSSSKGGDGKMTTAQKKPAKRGFAAMDPARQREIAAQGGRAAHESGNAHQFNSEEARAAGKKSHSGQRRNTGPSAGRRSLGSLQEAIRTHAGPAR